MKPRSAFWLSLAASVSTMAVFMTLLVEASSAWPIGNALGVVRVEQRGVGVALDDHGELPAQVVRVLDAGVEALTGGRRVDVGGVARDEAPADVHRRVPRAAGW